MSDPRLTRLLLNLVLLVSTGIAAGDDNRRQSELNQQFKHQVVPLLQLYCSSCHDEQTQEAELNLMSFRGVEEVNQAHRLWETVLERVQAGEMPPADADRQPSGEERQAIVSWIQDVRQFEADRNAGDPGVVLARRLSNSEYDHSIRDLTGVDIRPTKTFPVDPANEAGFDNSGESLTMSPALLNKYLEAARTVVDHLVLTPDGFHFAPHPVTTDTDRDKYCVKRIVEFYQRQPTDLADYFLAAWSLQHRHALEMPDVTLSEMAERFLVSSKYLTLVWDSLTAEDVAWGPLARLQFMWQQLPTQPADSTTQMLSQAKLGCEQMRDYVLQVRPRFQPFFDNLSIEGIHKGSQPFVLWKNKQYAGHRRKADVSFLLAKQPDVEKAANELLNLPPDEAMDERFQVDCEKFCNVFPDAFYVSERGRDYLGKNRDEQEKGRLLSAGFHSMMGYFRDDQPLVELLLDASSSAELDSLWNELNFFTAAPQRQYQGFLWFERTDSRFMREPQFDFARPEDRASLTAASIAQLAEVYLAKAVASGGDGVGLQAIEEYFREINEHIRWVEQARLEAQPKHLDALLNFAERAYRRPLTETETRELLTYYRELRDDHQLTHAEALQDTLVSVLMSPRFCYRVDLLSDSEQPRALTDLELASRLSYFLWASLPDAELLALARAGELRQPEILKSQMRRMLEDSRIRGLAVEFGGNWLDFRRFEEHNSVDRQRFPSFDDALRSAMFEEPVHLLLDVIQRDRRLVELIATQRTFVNASLAKHYGMDAIQFMGDEWREVTDASHFGRGGLLPMAVFLTKNAPGLRTSPVKRGYWIVRRLLGEHIPAPPADVPDLPNDESQLAGLTLRETLARHREHTSCSGCHNRIDSLGLVFEGYGPVGERRSVDLGGRPIDDTAIFPDGSHRQGVEDLRSYVGEERQADFVTNFARKLLSYALGRSLQLSDHKLLQEIHSDLAADGYQFSRLVEAVVTSPQFLTKRGKLAPPNSFTHLEKLDDSTTR